MKLCEFVRIWGTWGHAVKIKLTLSGPQWAEALDVFTEAANYFGMVSRKSLWGQFWSSHQRFFKYLCIASKVRRLVELAKKELEAGKVSSITPLKESLVCRLNVFCFKAESIFCFLFVRQCVVIGLQSTGEARTREVLDENEGHLDKFVSAAE